MELLDLNDDCMMKILEYLTIAELSQVASTCTHLKRNARNVFYRCKRSSVVKLKADSPNGHGILHHFGDLITNISVLFDNHFCNKFSVSNTKLFNRMVNYCTGSIDVLIMTCAQDLNNEQINNGAKLFRKVRELRLYFCDNTCGQCLYDARELTKLIVQINYESNIFLSNKYPQLQSFELSDSLGTGAHVYFNCSELNTFLTNHKDLTEFIFHAHQNFNYSLLADMTELRRLDISYHYNEGSQDDFQTVAKFLNVESLKFTIIDPSLQLAYSSEIVEFLHGFSRSNTLTEFELDMHSFFECQCNRMIRTLMQFNNLQVVNLPYGNPCIDITHLRHSLRELHKPQKVIFPSAYSLMAGLIESGMNKLICCISCYSCTLQWDPFYQHLGGIYRVDNETLILSIYCQLHVSTKFNYQIFMKFIRHCNALTNGSTYFAPGKDAYMLT